MENKQYKLTDPKPEDAKYVLIYADFCQYFKYKTEAEKAQSGLPYYYQEDSRIEQIKGGNK